MYYINIFKQSPHPEMLWKSIMMLWGNKISCSLRAKLSEVFPGSRIICHKGFKISFRFLFKFLSEKLWNRPHVDKSISLCLLKYSAFFHLVIFQHSITTTDLASLFWEGSLDTITSFSALPHQSCKAVGTEASMFREEWFFQMMENRF